MPSLGRAMADALIEIGITTPAALRRAGAGEAWRRLRFAHGRRITLTWIYALDVAIRGGRWDDLTPARTVALRRLAETLCAEVENTAPVNRKG